jgi:hypothetical protein
LQIEEYCREIEAYLCRKNDGHLIRVVGPSFDLVSAWAAQGVPLKIAFEGIERYFVRYYRQGARRRPVRIDFCEHDVLEAFDEWRRATGIATLPETGTGSDAGDPARPGRSLPAHLTRVAVRLTSARATGAVDAAFDDLLDRVSHELEAARADARGVRGAARQELIDRLTELDREMLALARQALDESGAAEIVREADEELATFRISMAPAAFARAREAAIDRLVRERFGLPTIAFV